VPQAVDPKSFPELGKADTRSGKDFGSIAYVTAPERLIGRSGKTQGGTHPMPDDSHVALSR